MGAYMTVFCEISALNGQLAHYVCYNGTVTAKIGGRYKSAPLRHGIHPKTVAMRLLRELLEEALRR